LAAPFDIFKLDPDGNAHWVEAAQDLEAAKVRVSSLAQVFPGEYAIVDNATGEKLLIKSNVN
jgi:hypothetical protein